MYLYFDRYREGSAVAMTEVNGQRVRRTQAERTAAMRTRLLDATIECLVTYGYAGTTTPRVAQLAGVTRGAQIHHFRSKEDLVVAAIEHLAQQRAQGAIRELGRVQASPDPVSMVLDFLWEAHQGPMFVATLELWVGARTDPVLAAQIERVEPVVNSTLIAAISQLVADHTAQKEIRKSSTRRWTRCGGFWWRVSSIGTPNVRAAAGTGPASICGYCSLMCCPRRRWASRRR